MPGSHPKYWWDEYRQTIGNEPIPEEIEGAEYRWKEE